MATEIINMYDFELRTDTLYEVVEKFDSSAPDAFKKLETTKVLSNEVHNGVPVATFNDYLSQWDIGLNLESPLLKTVIADETVRKQILERVHTHIKEPFEKIKGSKSLNVSEDNNKFWDNYSIEIHTGKVFNTADPIQLFELYNLLLRRVLTPKDAQSNPNFKESQYCIVDKDSSMNKESEKASRRTKAFGLYWSMKTNNKTGLLTILNYLGINVTESTSDSSLDLSFSKFIEHAKESTANTKEFISVTEEYSTKKGKDIINIYIQLKEMYTKGIVELRGKEVYLDGIYVASSFKGASKVIATDKELMKIFTSKIQ